MAISEKKRKTVDAYDKEHYKNYNIKFRLKEDADLMAELQKCKDNNVPYRVFFSELYGKTSSGYTKEQIIKVFDGFRGTLTPELIERMLNEAER